METPLKMEDSQPPAKTIPATVKCHSGGLICTLFKEMWWGTLGTVRPFPDFNPLKDAQEVKTALEKKDGNTMVRILTNRTNAQRQLITRAYHSLTGKDMSFTLKKCLSGALQELMLGLMMTPSQFDAHRLRQAMEGLGTDEETLLEVLCTRSAEQLKDITVAYKQEFDRYLENDLISETSKDFTTLLLAILTKQRENQQGVIDYELIDGDINTLTDAFSNKRVDMASWIKVLTTRDAEHLNRVLSKWEQVQGVLVEKVIQNHFSGDLKLGFCILVQSIQNSPRYLAHRLLTSMKKSSVVRGVLVSHCEEDLLSIRVEFRRLAGLSLYSALQEVHNFQLCHLLSLIKQWRQRVSIKKDFKGELQQAFLALCGAEDL